MSARLLCSSQQMPTEGSSKMAQKTRCSGTGDIAQFTECLPGIRKALGSIPSTI